MKNKIISFLTGLILFIIISPIRGYFDMSMSIFFGYFMYFIVTFYLCKKFQPDFFLTALFILFGLLAIQIPLRFSNWTISLISFPDAIFNALGIVSGFFFNKTNKYLKYFVPLVLSVTAFFMGFVGFKYWVHKLNFGTYSGVSNIKLPTPLIGLTNNNQFIDLTNEKKYRMLDFWHTKCGYCFEAFPKLELIYKENMNNKNLLIFAVNKRLEVDSLNQAFDVIQKNKYSFPVLLPKNDSLPEYFGITVYPTTVLIDNQNKIVYKGELADCYKEYQKLNKLD